MSGGVRVGDVNSMRPRGFRRPGLILREIGDAAGDSRSAMDVADFREGAAQLSLEERKMGAGEDDRVDAVSVLAHRTSVGLPLARHQC